MTPGEWTAIGGAVSGIAGVVWGWAFASGRYKSKIDSHGKILDQIVKDFSECQKRGTECTSSTRILFDATTRRLQELQNEFTQHRAAVHAHHESQEIHTTAEWRKNVFSRLDKIEEAFNKKTEDQTRTLSDRIAAVERAIRNGGK